MHYAGTIIFIYCTPILLLFDNFQFYEFFNFRYKGGEKINRIFLDKIVLQENFTIYENKERITKLRSLTHKIPDLGILFIRHLSVIFKMKIIP